MSKFIAQNSGEVRKWQKAGLGIILVTCLVTFGFSQGAVAADQPIKILFMAELTGQRAQVSQDMVQGFQMFMEEVGYNIAGRKIEVYVEDHGEPNVAISKLRRYISKEKIDIVAGMFCTFAAYAIIPLIQEADLALVISGAAGDDITQRKWNNNIVRVNHAGCQVGHIGGDYAYNQLGWRRISILSWEHAFGQETVGAFQRAFEGAGGKVVQRIYMPRETVDFGPYVSNLKKDVDGMFEVVTASPALNFFKALRTTGFMENKKVLTVLTGTDESFLQELGDTGLGVLSVNSYSGALDLPENVKFREKVFKLHRKDVTGPFVESYIAGMWLAKSIEAVNGNVEDRDKFHSAMQKVTFDKSPKGPISVDSHGNIVQDVYIRKVEKVNDHYQNTVVYTYPQKSQFWNFDEKAYLNNPPYSSENPPCKYCE